MTREELPSWLRAPQRRPLIMGVLNVTPDSFSDGGRFATFEAAVAHGQQMAAEGADLIDIGGESTRPGSQPVPPEEQSRRIVPVIRALAPRVSAVVSVDTTSAQVAEAALDAGAYVLNDIAAGVDDPAMLPLAARRRVPIMLMHMLGRPATMQENPTYKDVMADVAAFLRARLSAAVEAGIDRSNVLLDPGIGFGKTLEHNLELLRRLRELAAIGQPLVLGVSRKRFLGTITGESEPEKRVFGTAAAVAWCAANGASILRVHDVKPMAQVVRTVWAIQEARARA